VILPAVAPFVAAPVEAGERGRLKNASGDLIVLDARYAAWASAPRVDGKDDDKDDDNGQDDEGDEPAIEMARGSDASTERSVLATVRIKNPNRSRVSVFVRRELLTFEVLTPTGSVSCATEPDARNPDRHAFSFLAPHASLTLTSRLVELCPRGTFGDAGIYVIHAELDATVGGDDVGVDAFTGTLKTERPTLVRVRHALHVIPNRVPLAGAAPNQAAAPVAMPPGVAPPPPAPPPPPPPAQ
jgi:hypothetical protein